MSGSLVPQSAVRDFGVDIVFRAITRDASVYPEPDAFNPERFEIQDRKPTPLDPREYVFGFGRRYVISSGFGCLFKLTITTCRKCAGYNFANDVLALTIASMLATLDMSKVDGEKVEESYTRGFVRYVVFNAPNNDLTRPMTVILSLSSATSDLAPTQQPL
jgi:cytochrome P450